NDTFYGAAKAFNEGMLRSFHAMNGLDYVALRYFNVYGPRMDAHGRYTEVLIRWMERIAAGQPPLVFGDGAQTMDFVHVADIARANILAAQAAATDEVFNIATGVETSLRELAQALTAAMGATLGVEHRAERAVNGVSRRLADISAAAERLGWKPEISLADGLRDLVAWWREDRGATASERGAEHTEATASEHRRAAGSTGGQQTSRTRPEERSERGAEGMGTAQGVAL